MHPLGRVPAVVWAVVVRRWQAWASSAPGAAEKQLRYLNQRAGAIRITRGFRRPWLPESPTAAQTLAAMPQIQAAWLDQAAVEQLLAKRDAVREMLRPQ